MRKRVTTVRERGRERELEKETGNEWKMEREGSGERTRLIIQHYPCSLFMALLEQPVEAIYTHTVGTGCSLKYSSPGKLQPKKQGKQQDKRDYILIRERVGYESEVDGKKETESSHEKKMRQRET